MTARRSNGAGTIHRDTERDGWVGQVYIDGRRRKVRAKTKIDVATKITALKAGEINGTTIADGNATVGQVLDLWRERVLANRGGPGHGVELRLGVRVLMTEFGKVRLRTLDVERVERGIDRIATGTVNGRGKPVSRRTLTLMRSTLVQTLDLAVRRKLITSNPALASELTPTAPRTQPRRALRDEAGELWAILDGQRLGNLFKLMLTTGLRSGEALGLCWDSVDLDTGWLTVRRAVRRERGAAVLAEHVKTDSSYRTITVPAPALAVLQDQRRPVATMKLAARMWAIDDPGLVFPTTHGTPWNPANARHELYNILDAAGLPRLRPHELRHSCASILSDNGVPLEEIADLLGHKDSTMLARTYRHRLRPSVTAAVATMDTLFGS